MKLVTAADMRELDRRTIEEVGVPSLVLMENAGRSTYLVLRREFPDLRGPVAVLAGRGNNGGDGCVVARYAANAGLPVWVLLVARREQVSGDARVNLEILDRLGVEVVEVPEAEVFREHLPRLREAGLIVDALLGTGLNAPVRGLLAEVIEAAGRLPVPVLAVDIPSGLCADTGQVLGVALRAEVTVTYGLPKLGQILPPGRELCGRLFRVDISIPPHLLRPLPTELAEAQEMAGLVPARPFAAHKGTFGHAVVLAGSVGKTGAAALAGEAALRAGAGLVTVAVPESLNDILEVKLTEVMSLPLPEVPEVRALSRRALPPLWEFLRDKTALALGPGLGTHPETRELVQELVRTLPLPLVIDADGVNCLAGAGECLLQAPASRILTPHPGELARFLGAATADLQARRLEVARETARNYQCLVVLKGAQTVVAAPDGRLSINPTGNPGLASGGTGDVLTGLIGGLLAQRLAPWDAARLGVYLHGLAADYLAADLGPRGFAAGDLLRVLPRALADLAAGRIPPPEGDPCIQRVIS
ncbi:MAG: NAD(P)H-hydrate dehydratase [Syntrophobacterales bacterium]|nr:NAD(P)H-hydrate dehydratase [Syntrophobacterales bacterium]